MRTQTHINRLKHQLEQLGCFKNIDTIEVITQGHSQLCFQVISNDCVYFAKYFSETMSSNAVIAITAQASINGLTPEIIFHNEQWLITVFINGSSLQDAQIPKRDKLTTAISVMAKCHQLSSTSVGIVSNPPKLTLFPVVTGLISTLIADKNISVQQQLALTSLKVQVQEYELKQVSHANKHSNLVLCHGDLNFSNIMHNSKDNQQYLVDFDCACLAEIEYDIGMMLAINEFSSAAVESNSNLDFISALYQEACQIKYKIQYKKVTRYYLFSSLINMLWYIDKYLLGWGVKYKQHAIVQINHLDSSRLISNSVIKGIKESFNLY